MSTIKLLFSLSFFFILTMSCNETKTPSTAVQEATTATEVIDKEVPLTIFQHSFLNVSPGGQIAEHEAVLEKALIQTGEGEVGIYNLKDANNTVVAYFLADPMDNQLIGNLYITSPLAQTEDGIRIGDTFGDLVTKYKELEVSGSEIKSQIYANQGNLFFKIDEPYTKSDLEIRAVSKEAKIVGIFIKR